MQRFILNDLKQWQRHYQRKPLILMGARQVGKTYILKAFAKEAYSTMAYVNFESSPKLRELFARGLQPKEIIQLLSIELSLTITATQTLIIFDEIQECPEALNSLKYFAELANEYHICAAGSLLGVTLMNTKGFPVGKVDFLHMYPLSFMEFLLAKEEKQLLTFLGEIKTIAPLPEFLHDKLLNYFKTYLYTGGMPAAVLDYLTTSEMQSIQNIQNNILAAYQLDFAKHAPTNIIMKINQVWNAIPSQLAKENKKFIYSVMRKGARAQEFETAIQWLTEAGLIYKIYQLSVPKLPLKAYMNHEIFKIYLLDVGLLSAMTHLSAKTIIYGDEIFQEFKGALIENYVAQELARQQYGLYYWTSHGQAELDFILQHENQIYPLEVKSGTSAKKKSLITYAQKYAPTLQIRVSPMNLNKNGSILNCPLYLLEILQQLLR